MANICYAFLDENNKCVSLLETFEELKNIVNKKYVIIPSLNQNLISKIWNGTEFVEDESNLKTNTFIYVNSVKANLDDTTKNLLKSAIEANKIVNWRTADGDYIKLTNEELVYIDSKIKEYEASDKSNNIYF